MSFKNSYGSVELQWKSLLFLPGWMHTLVFHQQLMIQAVYICAQILSSLLFQVLYCGYYEQFSHNFRLSALGTFSSNIQPWHLQSNSGHKRSKTDRAHSYQNYFTIIPTEHTRAQITFCSLQMQAHNGGAGEQQSPLTETKHYHIIETKFQHLSEVIYLMLVQAYKFSIHVENSVPLP